MIVAQVKTLEFHLKPEVHTVKYAETARKAEFSEPKDHQVPLILAASLEEAVELARAAVQDRLRQFVVAKLNPADFRFDLWYTGVADGGQFWNNYSSCGGNHPACLIPTTP